MVEGAGQPYTAFSKGPSQTSASPRLFTPTELVLLTFNLLSHSREKVDSI